MPARMMQATVATVVLGVTLGLSGCRLHTSNGSSVKESWNPGQDDPARLSPISPADVHSFAKMSLRGHVASAQFTANAAVEMRFNGAGKLWNGSYWPLEDGGVASRWQFSPKQISGRLVPFDPRVALPQATLDTLSPIEKYDLVSGQFHFPSSARELSLRPDNQKAWESWEGYCHGWTVAAINELAPVRPFSMPIPGTEQSILFQPDDVKALLSKFYGDYIASGPVNSNRLTIIGGQCPETEAQLAAKIDLKTGRLLGSLACSDVNPGTMLIVLNYVMGERVPSNLRESLAMDVNAAQQKWNTPIVAYDTVFRQHPGMTNPLEVAALRDVQKEPLKTASNVGCKARIELDKKLGMWTYRGDGNGERVACIVDLQMSVWHLAFHNGAPPASTHTLRSLDKKTFLFSIELDATGDIIGGEWDWSNSATQSGARPDTIWKALVDYNTLQTHTEDAPVTWENMQNIMRAAGLAR